MPSYLAVVKQFLSSYVMDEPTSAQRKNFAKKKGGWYVQTKNYFSDTVLTESLFWDAKEKKYLDISKNFKKGDEVADTDGLLSIFLTGDALYDWYNFERCPYYGYKNWQQDVITDFGSASIENDTLLEGLARAYDDAANNYLSISNTAATAEGIKHVVENYNKTIETEKILLKRNPQYLTRVGHIDVKINNDCMDAWLKLSMYGYSKEAAVFVDKAAYSDAVIDYAKNYLNSCPANSILFTFGDNDTYPLWYVQQKLKYKPGISVINNSLLGLWQYVSFLKTQNIVSFAIPAKAINDNQLLYVQYSSDGSGNRPIPVAKFLEDIYNKKMVGTPNNDTVVQFSARQVTLNINAAAHTGLYGAALPAVTITLDKNIYLLNDLVTLDILATNVNTRPVCSTVTEPITDFANMYQTGCVYRFMPIENNAGATAGQAKALIQYMQNGDNGQHFIPVVTNSSKNMDGTFFANNVYFEICYKWITAATEQSAEAAKNAASKALQALNIHDNFYAEYSQGFFAVTVIKAGLKEEGLVMADNAARSFEHSYLYPSAVNVYYSKQYFKNSLANLQLGLQNIANAESPFINFLIEKYK